MKHHGPRGYGYAAGAAGLSTGSTIRDIRPVHTHDTLPSQGNKRDKNEMNNCPTCGNIVYSAEQQKAGKRKYHKLCFKCGK